ncbi:MAG: NAD(P)/FAD-dependent oxidoreductase [Hyphomicrobiales bacterium]|nr:NAD(P)/FAD-dependent oxidoreductase [Hyphomicrobiales bacterium]
MAETVDSVVIGAGVVGLAVARALARAGREVVILESEPAFGSGVSSRNSEVIHAGIYYPQGSLKARACVAGRDMMYDFCASHGVAHRRCGKLIVATDEAQLPVLDDLAAKARANGVGDLEFLDGPAARALEPALRAAGALLSPSTGIVDSHGLMLALLGDAEAAGAVLALSCPVVGGAARPGGGFVLRTGGAEPMELHCAQVVNSAGLGAQRVALALDGLAPETVPPLHYAKGNYFVLAGRAPFDHLIYPVPEAAGLGVHLTLDLGGQAKFGPDVEWLDGPGYDFDVDPRRGDSFYAAVRAYWPALPDGALQPGYAGMRPKLQARGGPAGDFVVMGAEGHGLPGLVNLFGIESPGLTASLAIADLVLAELVRDRL